MNKLILLFSSLFLALTFNGCGEEGEEDSGTNEVTQGWHFQGRDCLACHNVDLKQEKHLLFGGTLYKSSPVSDQDNLDNVCGGKFVINFLDDNFNTVYSSKDYEDPDSKGYDAKGNLFILQRKLPQISPGDYYMQITSEDGTVMAVQSHYFSGAEYDINYPDDGGNQIACNACHANNGQQDPIYVQTPTSRDLCQ